MHDPDNVQVSHLAQEDARVPGSRRPRRSWRTMLGVSLVALLLLSMLAACGGGDDDDEGDDTASPTAATSAPTSTTASGSGAAASPTAEEVEPTATTAASPTATEAEEAEASPTAEGTAPSRPMATQPPVAPSATTGTDDGTGAVEDALLSVLITADDLGTGWTQDSFGPDPEEESTSTNICGIPDFPGKDEKISQVESQSNYDDGTVGGLYAENLTAFPEDVAMDAFAYAVEGAACGTWVDDSGNEHVLTLAEDPMLGDESAAYTWQFTTQGQVLTGYYTFVRVGPFVALFGWLGLPSLDDDEMMLITAEAVDRITTLSTAMTPGDDTAPAGDLQTQAENALLTADQLNAIMPGWTDLGLVEADLEDRYTVCDNPSFAEVFTPEAEAAAEYELDGEFQGNLSHAMVVMADGEGVTAMEQIRSDAQCGSWSDGSNTIVITEQPDPAVGEETLLLLLDVSDSSGESGYAAIAYTRWGDVISVVAAVSFDPIDPLFLEMAQQQVEMNIAAS